MEEKVNFFLSLRRLRQELLGTRHFNNKFSFVLFIVLPFLITSVTAPPSRPPPSPRPLARPHMPTAPRSGRHALGQTEGLDRVHADTGIRTHSCMYAHIYLHVYEGPISQVQNRKLDLFHGHTQTYTHRKKGKYKITISTHTYTKPNTHADKNTHKNTHNNHTATHDPPPPQHKPS